MRRIIPVMACLCLLSLGTILNADDTAIFTGEASGAVIPNVLIVFDNSGSMESLLPGSQYSNAVNYEGTSGCSTCSQYTKDAIYYLTASGTYALFPPATTASITYENIGCADAHDDLRDKGTWQGKIYTTSPYDCGRKAKSYTLYRGHYLNFKNWVTAGFGTTTKSKLQIARDTLEDVLTTVSPDAVRFGLMIYNYNTSNDGGRLIAPIGSTKDQILAAVDAQVMCGECDHNNTPLAETLATAGLYMAGKQDWAATTREWVSTGWYSGYWTSPVYKNFDHASPVQYKCQKNYVLLLTDGMPTSDTGTHSVTAQDIFGSTWSQYYFGTGKKVGDYDDNKADNGTTTGDDSGYVDDVAKFLYEGKIFTGLTPSVVADVVGGASGTDDDGANKIVTYAIGFGDDFASGNAGNNFDYLTKITDSSHGRGAAYKAANSTDLADAFQKVVADIMVANSSFIAPVVPVSKLNKVYSGNSVYLSLFLPDSSKSFWSGNIKKFGLGPGGSILDRNLSGATDQYGQIDNDASSCWQSSSSDGSAPKEGGAGAVILTQGANGERHFYTYPSTATTPNLTHSTNDFATAAAAASPPLEADVVTWLTTSTGRDWVLGDILHSKPATMLYQTDNNHTTGDATDKKYDTILFFGSNDGFFHCLVDDDHGSADNLSDDTVSEAWSFFPWEIKSNISALKGDGAHSAYVDGSPTIYDDGGNRYVAFGLRRGGNVYYSLKVGTVNSTTGEYQGGYTTPYYNWRIPANFLLADYSEPLGQSWCKPLLSTIRTGATTTNKVLLFTGGYDTNQDAASPGADDEGRAIFAVDAADKTLNTNLTFTSSNTSGVSKMNHCIVELTAFDKDGDGCDDTIYAGDLGGNLFGFEDRVDKNGVWSNVKLFNARGTTGTSGMLLKFFYEPDVAVMSNYDFVYIGTGDREDPGNKTTQNRIYAIKNYWNTSSVNLNENDLEDVTSYDYSETTLANLSSKMGWFIRLEDNDGEKVVSSPLVYNKIVFFTTYIPGADTANDDPCASGNLGTGKLYALDYLTGKAVMDFSTTNGTDIGDPDRSTTLGTGIPSAPTLVVTKDGGAMLIIGTSGAEGTTGARTFTIPSSSRANMYYWKQD